ncbi:MAG: hypothetical protein UV78_C0034G0007 [Parcubacteria group bacterium GW2011_GWA2_43_17]|nr:MAG: hypothetical protein UV78_C0034G0007 [Parcubacteria group bacterium GW2011_GWA2_43_17]OHB42132.1 MAG: hypothetical protein A2Y13_07455 [Planctomycetes bacterium GWC2_45_44]
MSFNWAKNISMVLFLCLSTCFVEANVKFAKVAEHKGKPTIFINDEPVSSIAYALTEEGRFTWEEAPSRNLAMFYEQGYRVFSLYAYFKDVWCLDNSIDLSLIKKQIRGLIMMCPDAAIILRVHVDAPPWYNQKNLDESVEYTSGPVKMHGMDTDRVLRMSFASKKWRYDTMCVLKRICNELSDSVEGEHIIGLHFATGTFGEWHYWGFPEEPDSGKAMTREFRKWLKGKYGNDQTLQKAWGNPEISIQTASVPKLQERQSTTAGVFRDPTMERNVIDYYQCQQEIVADVILEVCKTAKLSWHRPVITGVLYGYFFNMFGMMASGGHIEMERILSSPDIDFLSAPISYEIESRKVGGTGQSRGIMLSCRLHGKLWLDEIDHPTYLGDCFGRLAPFTPENVADSISVMRRNAMRTLTQGMGAYWFDFGPTRKSGWFDDPNLMTEVGRIRERFFAKLNSQYESDADVLFIYDDQCAYYMGSKDKDPISPMVIEEMSAAAYRTGVAFDEVRLADLERINWEKYKVVVFANTFLLNDHQKKIIKEKIARDGRNLIWIYAPGYVNGDHLDVNYISTVTGMRIRKLDSQQTARIEIENIGKLGKIDFGTKLPINPSFVIEDSNVKPIGFYTGTKEVAFAKRQFKNYNSYYCVLPLNSADVMQYIFSECGAHIFNIQHDTTYIGNGLLCIHSEKGGSRQIVLRNGMKLNLDLQPRSTTVVDSMTGSLLFK